MRYIIVLTILIQFAFTESLYFGDGENYIAINPSEEVENMDGITISAWIYKEKNSNYEETLIDFGGLDSEDTPYRYIIKFEGKRIKAWVEGSAFDGSNLSFLTCANCLYDDLPIYDQWINIVAVYTPNSSKLYFNGMLIGSSIFNLSAESLSIFNNSGNYLIGKNAQVKDSFFNGHIDEVAVWSKPFSFIDVETLYDSKQNNDAFYRNNLIGFWSLNEGNGNLVIDKSIFNNNGIINGAQWDSFNRDISFREINSLENIDIQTSHYPNPFNSKVNLVYEISKPSMINVDIYDIMGRKIKSLVNNYYSSGINSVKWDGTNENNNLVPSGTYFYKVQTSVGIETNKIQFIK